MNTHTTHIHKNTHRGTQRNTHTQHSHLHMNEYKHTKALTVFTRSKVPAGCHMRVEIHGWTHISCQHCEGHMTGAEKDRVCRFGDGDDDGTPTVETQSQDQQGCTSNKQQTSSPHTPMKMMAPSCARKRKAKITS